MAYRKKGQRSKLLELAKRRKLKAAKDKEDKLEPMVIKPALSRLRTGAATKRKKGGQTLMDLAKRRKKPAAKKPTPKRKTSVSAATPNRKPRRTAAQRAAAKKKLLGKQKTTRAMGKKKSLTRFIPQMSVKGAEKVGRALELGGTAALMATPFAPAAAQRLAATTAGARVAGALSKAKKARDAAKASKVTRGIGSTRAASAASRTSGLGKAKVSLKKKPVSKKGGPSKFLSNILKKAAGYSKPKSAFTKTPKKKTQRRYPK